MELTDIIQKIYRNENPKKVIASLSKLVAQAAIEGDQTAINIISENANYLGESIVTLARRLFGYNHPEVISVVLTGGVFNSYDLLKESMIKAIPKDVQIDIIIPEIAPVSGAVIAGLREENIDIAVEFIENFHTSFKQKGNEDD